MVSWRTVPINPPQIRENPTTWFMVTTMSWFFFCRSFIFPSDFDNIFWLCKYIDIELAWKLNILPENEVVYKYNKSLRLQNFLTPIVARN